MERFLKPLTRRVSIHVVEAMVLHSERFTLETIKDVVDCLIGSVDSGINGKCRECSLKTLCDVLYELVVLGYRVCSDLMHGAVMHTILEVERTERDQKQYIEGFSGGP
ncbi:MAG: hypothetical protein N3F04_07570 [Candidatus Nezhaarchaeota archaeon]|nr:hypothetical protein [Candidatus Nezhaarchaeota archaeon]MCX8142604.1 hypothetical protein [Candidatus Nezhaarchaeota archaeon]